MKLKKQIYVSYHVTDNGEAMESPTAFPRVISYIPYGEIFVEQQSSGWQSPYMFNAKELDSETGLYYYGARYLDPTSAAWLSVDPMFEKYVGMSPYNYCMGNPVKLVDPDGTAPKSRIEYRGDGVFGINKNNLSRTSRFYMNQMNNDPHYWNNGEIGLNTTVFTLIINKYKYTAKPAGIDPKDASRTANYVKPLTKAGMPDKRYKDRTVNYFNPQGANVASFSRAALVIDAIIQFAQCKQSYDIYNDMSVLESNANSLEKAFASVRDYIKDGGNIPQKYNNEDGIGRLVNYVFQGGTGIDIDSETHRLDTSIMEIGNEILKKEGRYDTETNKPIFFIEE